MAVPASMNGTTRKREPRWPVTVSVYGVLFLFGAVQGLIGSFQYSRASGPVPVAALICCAVILATCVLAAWATRSVSGTTRSISSSEARRTTYSPRTGRTPQTTRAPSR